MYFHLSSFIAICLVVVSGGVANAGFHGFPFNRDLHLAEELGLDLKLLFEDRARFLALVAHIGDKDIDAEYTTMPIDHWNSSVGTYQNRYWVEDKHYRPGGPVFVYDAGETSADVFVQSQFKKPSILQQLLKEFHGMGIIWEHRYYGDSLPFPVGDDTPPEHLQYLTTEQALADIPHFAKTFRRGHCHRHDLTPQSTPWIMVGGSYPGARAAFTRNKYPDTIYAAYASSATVHAQVNLSAYYDQVYRGMIAHGYASCVKDIQAALEYIDDQLSNDETASAIKQLFFGGGAESNSNGDFTAALAGIYGFFQAYGTERPEIGSLHDFCSHLETDPRTHSQTSTDGLASIYGKKFVAERFAAWPTFTPLVNLNFGTNCGGLNDTIPAVCKLGRAITSRDDISWTWQYCTEWGVFQVDNPGPRSLLSRYQSVEYFQSICNQQFPEAFKSGLLPPHPQAETLNGETGGWSIRPSNVYWTSGEFDPWRPLSTLSTEQSCPTVSYSTDIPACGEPQVDRLFGFIMKDAEHCFDFRMNFEPGATAREHFVRALRKWLPCFKGKGGGRWNHHWA